jgi:hypothetical protein
MLRAHPRIYISHEAFFYVANRLCPVRASGRQFLEYYFQTWWFRWLGIDPARVLAGLPDPLPRKQVGLGFAAVMREKAAMYGKPRYGDKTPGHAVCLPEIFADFPDARVVHVVRDPRDTVQSLQKMPWTPPSLVFNALYLADERNQMSKFRHRILEVRLEDLLAEPRPTMKRVLDYVGEPWDEAVLDHAKSLPEESDIPEMPWHEGATRERSAAPGRREGLSPIQIRMVELIAWRTMKEAGYERAKLARTPNLFSVFLAMIRETPAVFRSLWVGMSFFRRMRRDPAALDQAENRALVRRLNPQAWKEEGDAAFHAPPPASTRELTPSTAPEPLLAGTPSASRSGEP